MDSQRDKQLEGGESVEEKEFYRKTEKFAKKIINLAAEGGMTVREIYNAADMVKRIADNSAVEREAIAKTDFPSTHIVEQPEMLFTPEDSSGTKYSPESIGIPCPIIDREQCQ